MSYTARQPTSQPGEVPAPAPAPVAARAAASVSARPYVCTYIYIWIVFVVYLRTRLLTCWLAGWLAKHGDYSGRQIARIQIHVFCMFYIFCIFSIFCIFCILENETVTGIMTLDVQKCCTVCHPKLESATVHQVSMVNITILETVALLFVQKSMMSV